MRCRGPLGDGTMQVRRRRRDEVGLVDAAATLACARATTCAQGRWWQGQLGEGTERAGEQVGQRRRACETQVAAREKRGQRE